MTSVFTTGRKHPILACLVVGGLAALLHPTDTPAVCGDGDIETDEECEVDSRGNDLFGSRTCMSEYHVSCGELYCFREGGITLTCIIDDFWSCGGLCGDGCARYPEECDDGTRNWEIVADG